MDFANIFLGNFILLEDSPPAGILNAGPCRDQLATF